MDIEKLKLTVEEQVYFIETAGADLCDAFGRALDAQLAKALWGIIYQVKGRSGNAHMYEHIYVFELVHALEAAGIPRPLEARLETPRAEHDDDEQAQQGQ